MSACAGKKRYESMLEANTAILRMWEKTNATRDERRSYYCDICGGWHITSMEQPSSR